MITQAGFSRAAVYRWGRVPGLFSDGDLDIWKTPGSCNRWYLDQFSPLRWQSRIDGFRENSMYLLFWSSCFIFHCMISLIHLCYPSWVLVDIMISVSCHCRKVTETQDAYFCIIVCKILSRSSITYLSTPTVGSWSQWGWGSSGSWSLPFVMEVMVECFVIDTHKR